MSRTNHHQRYKRWNIIGKRGHRQVEDHLGTEVYDLRFYAGCRRTPQHIRRVLHFHGCYPWRIHYGRDGVAKSYGDIREGQFRTATRWYVEAARAVWNAGGEVDEINEPDKRPRSIDWDLW